MNATCSTVRNLSVSNHLLCVLGVCIPFLAESAVLQAQTPAVKTAAALSKPESDCDVPPIRRAVANSVKKPSKDRVDWTTMASTYTHAADGVRVDQFAQGVEPVVFERPDYQRSGFRHTRSTLQAGFSADNYHVVEQWGGDVRPYGEWRYPNRPFAVPYGMWGPQLPQVVGGGAWGFPFPVAPFQNPGHPAAPPSSPPPSGAGPGGSGGMMMHGAHGMPHHPHGTHGMYPGTFNGWSGLFGVGPGNVLNPLQDDYYHQAPIPYLPPPPPIYNPVTSGLE